MKGWAKFYVLIFFVIVLLSPAGDANAWVKTRVIITHGGTEGFRQIIQDRLTNIMQEINKVHEDAGDLANIRPYFTDKAFLGIQCLCQKNDIYTNELEFQESLIEYTTPIFEVRGIKVIVNMGDMAGDPLKHLVFLFNMHAEIINVNYALEEHHYERLIEQGLELQDLEKREKIIHFTDVLRTAYNLKDIDFLKKVYDDDALIIVGLEYQPQETDADLLMGNFSETQIRYLKRSKKEYIEKLEKAFNENKFIDLQFKDIQVVKHPVYDDIYGVNIEQLWNSSNYNDQGFLFLLFRFSDELTEQNKIYVRTWQKEPFEDSTVINLNNFKIIR